jgi:RND family efflux transporter MFP subunit
MLPVFIPLTLLTLSLSFSGCKESVVEKKAPPPLAVNTITITKEKFPIWLQYTGKTKASSEQSVRARVAGRLEKVFFEDGAMVNRGDTLFLIEQNQYKSALASAKALKAKDIATLKLTEADVNRYKPLVKEGLAPRATLEQYEARYNELTAQIDADQAAIDEAALQLSYTEIKAPVSGRVSARLVDVGNLVGYGDVTLLTTIVKTDPLYAYFAPSEADVQLIQKFRSKDILDAFIEVASNNESVIQSKRLDGTINFADNTVDAMTSTISMRAEIDNPEGSVLPGTFVYVNVFVSDQIDFFLVPPQSIFENQLGKYVYTVKDNKAVQTIVETGYASRYYTVIRSGLNDGDQLIINGFMKLRDKMDVTPTDQTATEGIKAILEKNSLIPNEK